MDIYTLIKNDHDELRPMLHDLATGREDRLESTTRELKAHMQAEEISFYQPLEDVVEMRELIQEGYEKHREVDDLSQQVMAARGSGLFTARARQLEEAVEHHIQEEESNVFSQARRFLSQEDAESIGANLEHAKQASAWTGPR